MDISQGVTLENRQILSQTQIQSLEILRMDALELEEFLHEEYINNPLLDCTTNSPDLSFNDRVAVREMGMPGSRGRVSDEEDEGDLFDRIGKKSGDNLKTFLTDQLDPKRYTDREWKLCLYLIDCLEDDGYLRMDPEQITDLTGCSGEEVEKVLLDLRYLEPCGVFARDLQHCLLRQLEEMELDSPAMSEIVLYHLNDIAEGRISSISRALSISTSEVRRYISIIRELNSKPLTGFREENTVYIIPDIIYFKKGGQWEIRIKDGGYNNYHLNDFYVSMMDQTQDSELKEYFKAKLDRCQFIFNCMERRQKTMEAIARAILEKQEDYLSGQGRLKPMTMADLAEKIHMHQSTVGRAIKGKYVQSPAGTFLIKSLFCANATSSGPGEGMTANVIKEMITDIIEEEDKKKPYSDAKIVEILTKRGVHISRRAVAKYRDELFIKSSVDRKER